MASSLRVNKTAFLRPLDQLLQIADVEVGVAEIGRGVAHRGPKTKHFVQHPQDVRAQRQHQVDAAAVAALQRIERSCDKRAVGRDDQPTIGPGFAGKSVVVRLLG